MADQNITALPAVTTPESSDQLLLVGATEEKLIDYDKLADAILGKIASKNFALDQGNKTLLQALNELNSKGEMTRISLQSVDILTGVCQINKIGHVVWINYTGDAKTLKSGGWNTFFTLPEGFRPISLVYGTVRSSANVAIRISDSGEATYCVESTTTRQTNFQFSFCYFAK